jgi:hypothetical protein
MPNKRSINRKIVRAKVRFGNKTPINFGHTFNMSPFGLGITTTRTLPLNSNVTVNIYTNENNSNFISAKGRVAWTKHSIPGYPGKMGIKFDDPCHQLFNMYDNFKISLSGSPGR